MARLPRYVIPGQPQHIIQRGNNRQAIFAAEADFRFFRGALVEAASQHGLAIHAYVWMTNHIHLLATPEFDGSISKVFQSVGRRYVQSRLAAGMCSISTTPSRYRATVVDSEQYLLVLMRYIELNPVRAGMVVHPSEYPWSSYLFNAQGNGGANADWLLPHAEYLRLGSNPVDRQSAYRQLFRAAISGDNLAQIRECTHKGWAFGGIGVSSNIPTKCLNVRTARSQ
jgi:putative transposase